MRIEFLIVLTLAVGATFFVVVVSAGLIINKWMEVRAVRKRQKLYEFYSHMFAELLLKPLEEAERTRVALLRRYEEMMKPIKSGLEWSNPLRKKQHRWAIKQVLIDFSQDLEGESLDRLLYFFDTLEFVQEEIQLLSDEKWWVRAQAARDIGHLRAAEGIPHLTAALEDEHPDVRTQAIQSLVLLAGVQALGTILRASKNMSRWATVELSVIVRKFEGEAIPFLVEALRSSDLSVILFSIEMLAQIGFVEAVESMLEVARTYPNVVVRAKAVDALGRLGDQRAEPLLRELILNPYPSLRLSAIQALGRIGSPASVPMLFERMRGGEFIEQLSSARAIARSGKEGIKKLLSMADEKESLRDIASQVLEETGTGLATP